MTDFMEPMETDGEWISIADLMAALMIVFLFIAIAYIKPLADEQLRVKEIAIAWQASEEAIADALLAEFEGDLTTWGAEFDAPTLTIRFKSPDILFGHGKALLKTRFRSILDDFFPRYVATLARFSEDIAEVRIEGHTSPGWRGVDAHTAYIRNMELSQARTRAVLKYAVRPGADGDTPWLRPLLTANGLSSSRPVRDDAGVEDSIASRRVEFRVRTRTRAEIARILETVS